MIYFLRHGLDDERYIGGWSDVSLVDSGRKEILDAYLWMRNNLNIKKIISSDVLRAVESAEIIGEKLNSDDNFNDKTFVLTGTLSKLTRDQASLEIENRGGKVTNSVTKKTNVVIVGENPGSKYQKARDLEIEIWIEEEFISKL